MKTGVSISEEQGKIDWEQVKNAGIDYAMLCCGAGTGSEVKEDEFFRTNAEACMKYQIPFGVYLYSRAKELEQAYREAEGTLKILEAYSPDYPVMLWLEDCDTTLMLKRETIGDIAQLYCEKMMQGGYIPGIYANKYWFTNLLTDRRFNRWFRWVKQHYKECTYAGAYQMWQYTSDARIQGIQGPVKLSECYMDDWNMDVHENENRHNENSHADSIQSLPDLTGYTGVSLTGALNAGRYPSDFAYRAALAATVRLVPEKSDYRGTAEQNQRLLRILGGTLSNSKMIREGTYIKLRLGSRNINTGMPFEDKVYENTYQVLSISGISVIFGIRGTAIGKVSRNSVMVV